MVPMKPIGYGQLNKLNMKWDVCAVRLPHLFCAHHILPNLKRPRPQEPIVDRLPEVAAEAKEILREPMERQTGGT